MKTSLRILTVVFSLSTIIFLVNACKKDSSPSSSGADNNSAANMSANGATSDNAYDDVSSIAIQTGYDKNLDNFIQKRSGSNTLGYNFCATVTVTGSAFPYKVKVDFGSGCTSVDGVLRTGAITYTFTDYLRNPNAQVTAEFENYTVNGYQLSGSYTILNTSPQSLVPFSLKTTVTNGVIVYPSDSTYTFSGTKTATVTSGTFGDLSTLVFSVTGSYNVANANTGEALAANVTTPLERKEACGWVDKGTISFTYTKGTASAKGTFDYGDGTCDNQATIAIGSFTKAVTLP